MKTEKGITVKHAGNLYDDVRIDIEGAHRSFVKHNRRVFKRRHLYLTAFLVKVGLWQRLIDSGFIRDWFDEFSDYWINCLGCRPLKLHDFFYLHSQYRTKFQQVEVADNADAQEFTEAWQSYENIYLIFGSAYKYALSPLSFFRYRKYIRAAENILEYGCGVAPITFSSLKYGNFRNTKFTIADIKQFTYHFAKYRSAPLENVAFIDIETSILPKFPCRFGAVFIMEVLEHLPNPLETVKHIYQNIEDDGYLIFDYIRSEGKGLDTIKSVREREQVLGFIGEKFELVEGRIDKEASMGVTVVRKK